MTMLDLRFDGEISRPLCNEIVQYFLIVLFPKLCELEISEIIIQKPEKKP